MSAPRSVLLYALSANLLVMFVIPSQEEVQSLCGSTLSHHSILPAFGTMSLLFSDRDHNDIFSLFETILLHLRRNFSMSLNDGKHSTFANSFSTFANAFSCCVELRLSQRRMLVMRAF